MLKGVFYLSGAAFLFSLSTVFLKLAVSPPYLVPAEVGTFARFAVGLIAFGGYLLARHEPLRPNNPRAVSVRAVLNTLAVILFFAGIQYTTVTKANLLNLTYPAFVFLIAPFMTGEQQRVRDFGYLFLTLSGAALVVLGGGARVSFDGVNAGDVLALLSGVVAGFAISGLREARKHDSAQIILLYQMAFGTLATLLLMLPVFTVPRGMALVYILLTAALSNAGQYFITEGFRYISASFGSIVLESGIVFSAVLGITLLDDPVTPLIVAGGLLILFSITAVSGIFSRSRKPS